MKKTFFPRADTLLDGIYVEFVRSLYVAFIPSVIMSVGFVAGGVLIAQETGDSVLAVIVLAGTLASLVRLTIAWEGRAEAFAPGLGVERARRLERRFGLSYLAFALCLGAFGIRVFMLPATGPHMLAVCLLVGYGAGVSAGIALRPRIAVASMLVGIVPGVVAAFAVMHHSYWATAAMMLALLVGGIRSLLDRHRLMVKEIGRRITFGNLARRDVLTDLPNRLALREWFEEKVTFNPYAGLIAVHCLDLDGFKAVNDSLGHPIGDALLTAVARRLTQIIRNTDMVARLGGDEFAVVQCDINHPEEADLLARRIEAAIRQPFRIGGHVAKISTCVGYALSTDRDDDLEPLLSRADEALYVAKRTGGGIFRQEEEQAAPSLHAAA